MSNTLYVHNFRGFSNTFIPIKDVNFFVGENSTGKTSLLSLLTLLGLPEFWFRQEFNSERVQLGAFKDIISLQSTDRTFDLGFIVETRANENATYEAALMRFEEKDNAPLLMQYNYVSKQGQAKIVFTETQIKYKFSDLDTSVPTYQDIYEIFVGWTTADTDSEQTGFIPFIKKIETFDRRQALLFVDRILQRIHSENTHQPDDQVFSLKIPDFVSRLVWFAPIRSKPRKTYDEYKLDFNPEGEHTPYLVRRLLKQKRSSKEFRQFIEHFGAESGLFDSLDIKGYGKEAASPFELRVVLNNIPLALVNVGYGVSQALPVVVELFARPPRSQFAIQQPEVHLHPKAQAALGDVIFQLAANEKKCFFIETHSDYTIDRFRLNFRKEKEKTISSQVLFFSRQSQGNQISSVEILPNGEYSDDQPSAFRDFFIHEQMNLLGL